MWNACVWYLFLLPLFSKSLSLSSAALLHPSNTVSTSIQTTYWSFWRLTLAGLPCSSIKNIIHLRHLCNNNCVLSCRHVGFSWPAADPPQSPARVPHPKQVQSTTVEEVEVAGDTAEQRNRWEQGLCVFLECHFHHYTLTLTSYFIAMLLAKPSNIYYVLTHFMLRKQNYNLMSWSLLSYVLFFQVWCIVGRSGSLSGPMFFVLPPVHLEEERRPLVMHHRKLNTNSVPQTMLMGSPPLARDSAMGALEKEFVAFQCCCLLVDWLHLFEMFF